MKSDIPEARRIVRLAFGTFLGVPDPENFASDMDYVGTRWRADASAAFAAEVDGQLVGSNFATRWGSVGFFGPLTVRPDFWNKGVAQELMRPVMECFESWKVTHAGLFTFAESPKHLALYQKYGFYPRFLTAVLSKQPSQTSIRATWTKFSDAAAADRDAVIQACYKLTDALYPGLNVEREIRAVDEQGLGETALLREDGRLVAFAVCHCGPATEAGAGKLYVKFGAALSGETSGFHFDHLLNACEELAVSRGLTQIEAGVNLSRHEAYRSMLNRGFRAQRTGVTMHRPFEAAYSRQGIYVIDDWR
jgi:GNAT superfamily N-acetyltransferase